jgi:hypothetical protein
MRRTAARIDCNQSDIIRTLRDIPGVSVELGHDDFLVGYGGQTYWFECKTIDAVSKRTGKVNDSEITPSERRRLDTFTGHYSMIWTIDQVLEQIGIVKGEV